MSAASFIAVRDRGDDVEDDSIKLNSPPLDDLVGDRNNSEGPPKEFPIDANDVSESIIKVELCRDEDSCRSTASSVDLESLSCFINIKNTLWIDGSNSFLKQNFEKRNKIK